MIIDFIEKYVKLISAFPQDIEITKKQISDTFVEIDIVVNAADVGKLIGKNGNMINAIKTIANGYKAKNGISYKIQIVEK